MKSFTHINEIIDLNKKKNGSASFFSDADMRGFDSKVYNEIIHGNFFITSEQFSDSRGNKEPRYFSVRLARDNGQIRNVSKYQQFESKQAAIKWAKSLPPQLPEAMDYFERCYSLKTLGDFITQALIEHENTRPEDKERLNNPDSFTGACYWMLENYDKLDSAVLTSTAKGYWDEAKETGEVNI